MSGRIKQREEWRPLMEKYQDNYHEKFNKAYGREFTGELFNLAEFIQHLDNINFRFESSEIGKLSDEGIEKIKARFRFYQYGASVDGLVCITDSAYADAFKMLVARFGKKYGFRCEKPEHRRDERVD
jgi:hypothetical protein